MDLGVEGTQIVRNRGGAWSLDLSQSWVSLTSWVVWLSHLFSVLLNCPCFLIHKVKGCTRQIQLKL